MTERLIQQTKFYNYPYIVSVQIPTEEVPLPPDIMNAFPEGTKKVVFDLYLGRQNFRSEDNKVYQKYFEKATPSKIPSPSVPTLSQEEYNGNLDLLNVPVAPNKDLWTPERTLHVMSHGTEYVISYPHKEGVEYNQKRVTAKKRKKPESGSRTLQSGKALVEELEASGFPKGSFDLSILKEGNPNDIEYNRVTDAVSRTVGRKMSEWGMRHNPRPDGTVLYVVRANTPSKKIA